MNISYLIKLNYGLVQSVLRNVSNSDPRLVNRSKWLKDVIIYDSFSPALEPTATFHNFSHILHGFGKNAVDLVN